jgi:hypothetical protein
MAQKVHATSPSNREQDGIDPEIVKEIVQQGRRELSRARKLIFHCQILQLEKQLQVLEYSHQKNSLVQRP